MGSEAHVAWGAGGTSEAGRSTWYTPLFFCGSATGGRVKSIVRGGEPLFRTRGMIGSRSVYGKALTRQLHSNPTPVSGTGHTREQINPFDAVIHNAKTSASQVVISRMQLTLHATRRTPHGASRLVLAMSAWSVKIRRAPPRHCRVARVYGHMTKMRSCMILSTPLQRCSVSRRTRCSVSRISTSNGNEFSSFCTSSAHRIPQC